MKTRLYEFKINESTKLEICKHYLKNIKITDAKEIENVINRVEFRVCEYVDKMFKYIQIENKHIDYNLFKKELNKFVKKV